MAFLIIVFRLRRRFNISNDIANFSTKEETPNAKSVAPKTAFPPRTDVALYVYILYHIIHSLHVRRTNSCSKSHWAKFNSERNLKYNTIFHRKGRNGHVLNISAYKCNLNTSPSIFLGDFCDFRKFFSFAQQKLIHTCNF